MIRQAAPALALAVALSAGCEASYFAAEVEATEVCVVDLVVDFPGVPAIAAAEQVETTLDTAIGEDDLGISLSDDLEIDVSIVSVLMQPSAGVPDFGFIEQLALTMSQEVTIDPGAVIVSFSAANMQPDGAMYAEPEAALDLTTYIEAGELIVDFALSGELPENNWSATVDLCMSAGAKYVAPL